jgi:hypothetical protein
MISVLVTRGARAGHHPGAVWLAELDALASDELILSIPTTIHGVAQTAPPEFRNRLFVHFDLGAQAPCPPRPRRCEMIALGVVVLVSGPVAVKGGGEPRPVRAPSHQVFLRVARWQAAPVGMGLEVDA